MAGFPLPLPLPCRVVEAASASWSAIEAVFVEVVEPSVSVTVNCDCFRGRWHSPNLRHTRDPCSSGRHSFDDLVDSCMMTSLSKKLLGVAPAVDSVAHMWDPRNLPSVHRSLHNN